MRVINIPYSGKCLIGANFCIFCLISRRMKIKSTKSFTFKILSCQILNGGLPRGNVAIERWYFSSYFQPSGTLPNPSGSLSAYVSPAAIKNANEAVRNTLQGSSKPRGKYAKFTPEQKALIGEYALLHGNQVAIRHFLKQFGVEMKPTLVQTCRRGTPSPVTRPKMTTLTHTCILAKLSSVAFLHAHIRK